jgi:hypothetical protein
MAMPEYPETDEVGYDESCYDLAESFLEDDLDARPKYSAMSEADQNKCKHKLATLIQETIEDFLSQVEL